MPEEKFGIENIKDLIGFGLDASQAVQKAKEDGKVDWKDGFLFIPLLPKIPAAVRSAADIANEYSDLSDAERAEIKAFVVEKVHADNEKVEKLIEDALTLAIDVSVILEDIEVLVEDIKSLKE